MKLEIHLFPLGDDSLELIASLIPESNRKIISARWSIAQDEATLRDILLAGESTSGFGISVETRLSASELRELSHFEVVCRKIIPESDKDYEANQFACEQTPLMNRGGHCPIRLVSGFSSARIALKPNMVSAIGNWTGEYVVGTAVADIFSTSGLSGLSFLPIINPRNTSPHESYFQIFSDSVLAPVVMDSSIECILSSDPAEDGAMRHLGCLSYREDNLAEIPDFSRTAEPWQGWWGIPSWVVSARVVSTFREKILRGWAFRPVMVKESELYSSYLSSWTELHKLVAQCSKSRFDGGRW